MSARPFRGYGRRPPAATSSDRRSPHGSCQIAWTSARSRSSGGRTWRRPPPISSITSSRRCPCDSGNGSPHRVTRAAAQPKSATCSPGTRPLTGSARAARDRERRQAAAMGGHADDGRVTGGCCDATHATQKPRSHDTSRKSMGEADGSGGGGVSTCVPHLRRRHPAHRIHHRSGADPEDSDTPRRTARAGVTFTCSRPAHRLGRTRAGARRPGTGAEVPLTGLSFNRHTADGGRRDRS